MVAHTCIWEYIFFVSTSNSHINHVFANSVFPHVLKLSQNGKFLERFLNSSVVFAETLQLPTVTLCKFCEWSDSET